MHGFILTTHADHNPLVEALREEGIDVRRVDLNHPLPPLKGCFGFYGNLFDEIKNWPALFKLKQQLNRHHVPYVFWNRDAPWHVGMKRFNRWVLKLVKPVDIYLAHSLQDQSLFGGEVHYFPNAAQPAYYQNTDLEALRDESVYPNDVSFFGSIANGKACNAKRRAAFLEALQTELRQRIPGIRFSVLDASIRPLTQDEQLHLIRTSKINLNVGAMCDLAHRDSWGLPERVFGVPAAGGLVITDARQHVSDSFAQNCLPEFVTPQDCATLIESLLSDWSALRDLAEQQYRQVIECHTYQLRARELMRLLTDYRVLIGGRL